MTRGPNGGPNGISGPQQQQQQASPSQLDIPEMSPEELDAARTREITSKAMTGILILLMKWLRVSRELIHYPSSWV